MLRLLLTLSLALIVFGAAACNKADKAPAVADADAPMQSDSPAPGGVSSGDSGLSPSELPNLPPEPAAAETPQAAIDLASGQAPDFTFTSFDGSTKKLSDFRGKPVVLNFWATWCGPCKAEFPDFQKVASANPNFTLISITDSSSEKPQDFVKLNGYTWTFGLSDEAPTLYQVNAWPTTLFIDKTGKVAETAIGAIDHATFEQLLGKIV